MSNGKSGAREEIRFNVRISPDLHARITQRAKANGQSMNSEIIAMLEAALDDGKPADTDALAREALKVLNYLEVAHMQAKTHEERLDAIKEELRSSYGEIPSGEDPLTYAVREYYRRQDELIDRQRERMRDEDRMRQVRAFIKAHPETKEADRRTLINWPDDVAFPSSIDELRDR